MSRPSPGRGPAPAGFTVGGFERFPLGPLAGGAGLDGGVGGGALGLGLRELDVEAAQVQLLVVALAGLEEVDDGR